MKFLYIAPRYHTNQVEITKYLHENGHDVLFLAERATPSDNYKYLNPVILEESIYYRLFIKPFACLSRLSAEDFKIRHNIPSVCQLYRTILKYRPDLAIIRGNFLSVTLCYFILKMCGIKHIILYNQVPLYQELYECKSKKEKFKRALLPSKRMTPVLYGNSSKTKGLKKDPYAYFVPFVAPQVNIDRQKELIFINKIKILDVGKYRSYKNHTILVEAVDLLTLEERNKLSITIVGQSYKEEEMKYQNELKTLISTKGLDQTFTLLENYSHEKMDLLYQEHSFFILTSKIEVASISVIESMSMGLIPISSDANGTASYINPEIGYTFKSNNAESLCDILRKILKLTPSDIQYKSVSNTIFCRENYNGDKYYHAIENIITNE